MKFLTDENIARSLVKNLRKEGHDVKDIKEEKLYGMSDRKIIDIAFKEDRIIITHDRNFGHVTKDSNIKHKGVIFVRCKNQSPENTSIILLNVLRSKVSEKFKDSLTVISEDQVNIHKTDD